MVLDERILVILKVIAVACADLLELGFDTISLFEGHVGLVYWNVRVRRASGCSL